LPAESVTKKPGLLLSFNAADAIGAAGSPHRVRPVADKMPVGPTGPSRTGIRRLCYGSILVCFGSTAPRVWQCCTPRRALVCPRGTGPHLELDIAHVLCVDVIGYSKLLVDEQRALLDELNYVVRSTAQFRKAEAHGGSAGSDPSRNRF
jgi:hypothetical protein